MEEYRFYFNTEGLGLDCTDEKDVELYALPLTNFDCLTEYFYKMQTAHENGFRDKVQILTINVFPDVSGVFEFIVHHDIRRKLFSRKLKKNCFVLCVSQYENDGIAMYEYETENISEAKQLLKDFVCNYTVPNFDSWKRL